MRKYKIIYIVIICIILSLPIVLIPFAKGGSAEKRELSSFPEFIVDKKINLDFTKELEVWLSEHFPLREQLISTNNFLKAKLFHTSGEEKVIVGKEGWLYFSETLADFQGENVLTPDDAEKIKSTLSKMAESVEADGGKFVFTVAPNKNAVYPEFMPDRILKGEGDTSLDILEKTLPDRWYVDLRDALVSDEVLYHKTDSHWNAYGAYLAYSAIMEKLGEENAFEGVEYEWQNTFSGDLENMLYPTFSSLSPDAVFDKRVGYDVTSNYRSVEDLNITTENKTRQKSVLVIRDSFANALLPFFAESFGNVHFTRVYPKSLDELSGYDIVIFEIAQRNIKNILSISLEEK